MENRLFENMHDAAMFITEMVCKRCKINEDLKVLIQDFLTISWAFEKLRTQRTHPKILRQMKKSCEGTALYLWHKLVEEFDEDDES